MQNLITASYSKKESDKFCSYTLTDEDKRLIAQWGKEVLLNTPYMANACTIMSALWGAVIRDKTHIPVHVVAGNLSINNRKVFYNTGSPDSIRQELNVSNSIWDGHVWVDFAGVIGEISLFRTAYSKPDNHWLNQLIVSEFGKGRGLLLGTPANMQYEAKYVLTDGEITAFIKGLDALTQV